MARMPLTDRRRQLTEAAIRAMTRDGVSRTTTRSIAAEAGVSLSVFHYCFDSKQALLESVIETITAHYVTLVKAAILPRPTLRETVRAGFQAYWDHVAASPGAHLLTYELTQYALRQPEFGHLARKQYASYCEAYTVLLEELRLIHPFELSVPVHVLARYLAAMTDGVTLNFLVLGDDKAAAEILDMVTDHVTGLVVDTD
ncbi:TetR/AcrR family transcriptional regulator [Streptomyces sp. ZAF1911]|uniref:TetR/AcrR family transcriptional regulator n=1 Tax=unclassified Streptomyces TaxID=2593676 RepID=UPI00237ACCA4|nr:TetR/AcrR family transcriptional regulator [Streptomyces sp. ZAF1911]MDD9376415.1 TetR/AcrR family transcriptional regulator [Streptomyces sp. ZAF1911]